MTRVSFFILSTHLYSMVQRLKKIQEKRFVNRRNLEFGHWWNKNIQPIWPSALWVHKTNSNGFRSTCEKKPYAQKARVPKFSWQGSELKKIQLRSKATLHCSYLRCSLGYLQLCLVSNKLQISTFLSHPRPGLVICKLI